MADLSDAGVRELLENPNHAVVSTLNEDGSISSKIVWVSLEDGTLAVNSAVGRDWPSNLERDPRVTLLVYNAEDAFDYLEVRGRAEGTTEGADDHIDRLAKKYLNADSYPFRDPSEQRITYLITPEVINHVKG
jgi:PPOX class probable F420-dependent enzyme